MVQGQWTLIVRRRRLALKPVQSHVSASFPLWFSYIPKRSGWARPSTDGL